MEALMNVLNQVIAMVPDSQSAILVSIGVALEFVLRLFPSQKPLSILHGAVGVLRMLEKLFGLFNLLVKKLADALDKVLPQKLKELP